MGSCAAPSAKGDDKFITTDYLQQCRLKSLTRSAGYLSRMKVGASRYDLQGNAVATVTAEEAQYASERMMKELLRAERKMSQTL